MRRPDPRDAALAALVAAAIATELALRCTDAATAWAVLLTAAISLPLAWWRTAPVAAAAGAGAALLGWTVAADDLAPNALFVPLILAFYGVGAHVPRRGALHGILLIAALAVAAPVVAGTAFFDEAPFTVVFLGAPWLGGRLVRRHRDATERLAAVAEELRRERAEHERLAVLAERARIAAELNDAVAHALGEILMQAGAASKALAHDPEAATTALRAVQERGRAAVLELRRMLVLMRAGAS